MCTKPSFLIIIKPVERRKTTHHFKGATLALGSVSVTGSQSLMTMRVTTDRQQKGFSSTLSPLSATGRNRPFGPQIVTSNEPFTPQ